MEEEVEMEMRTLVVVVLIFVLALVGLGLAQLGVMLAVVGETKEAAKYLAASFGILLLLMLFVFV